MSGNGQAVNGLGDSVLRWTRRVLSAADLRSSLNGHRELLVGADTIVTPLAGEELRATGVRLRREEPGQPNGMSRVVGYGLDRDYGMVEAAVRALAREGLCSRLLGCCDDSLPCRWAKAVAECVARGECAGGVLFCSDPGLVCCVANKVAGLRAVPVTSVAQAVRATFGLSANLLAVEMPGRTFFEVRQILRTIADGNLAGCPDGVACTLRELDGHAHR